jgi:hypothetical protein
VLSQAKEAAATADGRVAVVLLDPLLLSDYNNAFSEADFKTILIHLVVMSRSYDL